MSQVQYFPVYCFLYTALSVHLGGGCLRQARFPCEVGNSRALSFERVQRLARWRLLIAAAVVLRQAIRCPELLKPLICVEVRCWYCCERCFGSMSSMTRLFVALRKLHPNVLGQDIVQLPVTNGSFLFGGNSRRSSNNN